MWEEAIGYYGDSSQYMGLYIVGGFYDNPTAQTIAVARDNPDPFIYSLSILVNLHHLT